MLKWKIERRLLRLRRQLLAVTPKTKKEMVIINRIVTAKRRLRHAV